MLNKKSCKLIVKIKAIQSIKFNPKIKIKKISSSRKELSIEKIETDLKLIYDNEIIDTWNNKVWPVDMLSELNWLVNEQAKNNNYLKKGDLILTGAYGFPVPINDKKLIEVTSSAFGDVKATFY